MPAVLVLDGRYALSLQRPRDDDRRSPCRRDRATERVVDRLDVVPVDLDRVPTECLCACEIGVEIPADHRLAALAEPVHVDDRRQVVELEVRGVLEGLPHGALGHLAVTAEHPDARGQPLEVFRRECHADADRQSLSERSGRDVDPRDARGRVALEHAPVRAVVEDLLVGDDTRGPVDRVQQRGRVALGEDEPVVRRALRLGEVVAEIAVDEDGEQVGCGHRGRGMSRPCGRAHPHRVDAELLSELSAVSPPSSRVPFYVRTPNR